MHWVVGTSKGGLQVLLSQNSSLLPCHLATAAGSSLPHAPCAWQFTAWHPLVSRVPQASALPTLQVGGRQGSALLWDGTQPMPGWGDLADWDEQGGYTQLELK